MNAKPEQSIDEKIESWHRNGGGWDVMSMASLIEDLISARQRTIDFVDRCADIREGSANAFYGHVDTFCKAES